MWSMESPSDFEQDPLDWECPASSLNNCSIALHFISTLGDSLLVAIKPIIFTLLHKNEYWRPSPPLQSFLNTEHLLNKTFSKQCKFQEWYLKVSMYYFEIPFLVFILTPGKEVDILNSTCPMHSQKDFALWWLLHTY